ncbi:MAG: hypothetical protein ACI8XO_002558 [Verrucomicrobiales bacterium]|jgi:hypothetical protein
MLEFDFEKDMEPEPGSWPKLITLAGLALFWFWIFRLIF